jgi:hypothetical protein
VYVEPSALDRLDAIDRHRLAAHAVAVQRPGVVFAGVTAAVLSDLPCVGARFGEVTVLAPGGSGRRRNGVRELVRGGVDARSITGGGLATTSLVDTLLEVARSQSLLTALVMVDAALYRPRTGAGSRCTIDELRARFAELLPFPSSRKVSAVLDRATDLAETPLETMSRVRVDEFGFPEPVLQFEVLRPRSGRLAYLDLAWPEHGIWGEADGAGKYLGGGAEGRSPAEVVREEKRREDEVRSATGWRCVRWDWMEAWRGDPLRRALVEAGLPLRPRRPRRARDAG